MPLCRSGGARRRGPRRGRVCGEIQNPPDAQGIDRDAHHRPRDVGDGLGVERGPGAEGRRQGEQGDEVHRLPEGGQGQGQLDLSHAGEPVHNGVLQPQGNQGQRAHVDGGESLRRQLRLRGEEAHEEGAPQPGQQEQGRHIGHAQSGDEGLGLQDPVPPPGAVVVGQDGACAGGNAPQGHGHHQHEALGDGGAGHQTVSQLRPAIGLEDGVHGDDHDVVHADDEEGRHAHRQDAEHQPPVIAAESDGDRHGLAEEEPQHIEAAGQLGEDRGHSSPGHPHVKEKDEHRVQHDVQRRPQHDGDHALPGVALADDELVQPQGQQVERRAAEVDGEIGIGVAVGGIAGAEGHQHGLVQGKDHHHQRHGADAQHQETVGEDPPGLLRLARPHADAHQRCAAHADERGEGADQGHHRPADPHARQGGLPDHGDVADVDAVHDAVQHADELGQHAGNGDPQHQRPDGVRAQVVLQFHNRSLPENTQKSGCLHQTALSL